MSLPPRSRSEDWNCSLTTALAMAELVAHYERQRAGDPRRETAAWLKALGARIDDGALDEGQARRMAQERFPFLDRGNLAWLNARGLILAA